MINNQLRAVLLVKGREQNIFLKDIIQKLCDILSINNIAKMCNSRAIHRKNPTIMSVQGVYMWLTINIK